MEIETVDLVLDSPTPPDGMYLEFAKAFVWRQLFFPFNDN